MCPTSKPPGRRGRRPHRLQPSALSPGGARGSSTPSSPGARSRHRVVAYSPFGHGASLAHEHRRPLSWIESRRTTAPRPSGPRSGSSRGAVQPHDPKASSPEHAADIRQRWLAALTEDEFMRIDAAFPRGSPDTPPSHVVARDARLVRADDRPPSRAPPGRGTIPPLGGDSRIGGSSERPTLPAER